MSAREHLRQALSRNKAREKQRLWELKRHEDEGCGFKLTLKSNDGKTSRTVTRVPQGAVVSASAVNAYEDERRRNAAGKENALLDRFCDGRDEVWRPEEFFSVASSQEDLPWSVRPEQYMNNPAVLQRIVDAYVASKKEAKKHRKSKRKEDKVNGREKQKCKKKKKKSKKDRKIKSPVRHAKMTRSCDVIGISSSESDGETVANAGRAECQARDASSDNNADTSDSS